MVQERGVAMLQGLPGSGGAEDHQGDLIQHSFWLFDTEENARRRPTARLCVDDQLIRAAGHVSKSRTCQADTHSPW